MSNQSLNEGLRPYDLKEMIYPTFHVDKFQSKMGEDRDVCVVNFCVKDRAPARDLMEFIEKGYEYVLDADVSSGENEYGEYSVFVELSRDEQLAEHIKEICYGVHKLTGIDDFKFKYYKGENEHELSEDAINSTVPTTPEKYDGFVIKLQTESVKRFFSKTLMDDLTLNGDIITIHKPFDQKIQLKMIKEAPTESILEGVEDGFSLDEAATAEIFWLTKVLGNYNINKVGENFVFDNNGQSMILQRV